MERSIAQVPSHAAAVGFFDKKGITDLISSLRHGGSRRETREAEYKRPVILMLGNEAQGLGDEELGICRQQVSIPVVGRRDSLNVGVAGGIVLYEIFARGSVSWEGVRDVITGQHRGSSGREESGADEV